VPLIHRIRAAKVAEWRDLAARARAQTYEPGWPYGGDGPAAWGPCIDGALGGPAGAYCAAVHPDLLLALLDEVERLRKEVP
jgi:hypothetical protein